ncbi:MAG: ABC transporter permease [bacterium]|nr:ABC transporter permease [bacterium]
MSHLPGTLFLRNLVERRSLIYQLVRRDFQQRYVGSAAGWLWGVIHPLVLLVCWTFVFQICINIELPRGEVTQNYAMFLLCGFMPWLLFQETVQRSATSIVEQSNLITKTVFPAEVIPVSVFLSALISHLLTLALVVAAVALVLKHFSLMLLLLPIYMLLLGVFAVGVGWIAASLHVYVRDTAQIVTVTLTLWFWLTPIFIYEEMYPEPVRFLLAINPLAYLVRAYRDRILSYRLPTLEEFAVLGMFAAVAFVVGGLFFRHLKRGFADVL